MLVHKRLNGREKVPPFCDVLRFSVICKTFPACWRSKGVYNKDQALILWTLGSCPQHEFIFLAESMVTRRDIAKFKMFEEKVFCCKKVSWSPQVKIVWCFSTEANVWCKKSQPPQVLAGKKPGGRGCSQLRESEPANIIDIIINSDSRYDFHHLHQDFKIIFLLTYICTCKPFHSDLFIFEEEKANVSLE